MLKGEKQKAINYLNVAIELDSSIYKEIETQSIFLPIIKSIKAPNLNNTLKIPISKLNKKEKRAALKSALTSRVQENKFIVVEELKFNEIKTKNFKNVLNNLKVNKALVVLSESDENAVLSARNIDDVKTAQVGTINVYDILKYNTVVASKAAVASIEEVYA